MSSNTFLTNGNYTTVVGFLRQHYANRLKINAIPDRMDSRIQKTVQHYMTEVAKANGTNKPVNFLNQEVLRESTGSLDNWLRKQHEDSVGPTVIQRPAVVSQMASSGTVYSTKPMSAVPSVPALMTPQVPPRPPVPTPTPKKSTFEDVNSLFGPPPDLSSSAFQTVEEDEEEDPVLLMKRAQKLREAEAPRISIQEISSAEPTSVDPTPQSQPPPIRTVPLPQDYIIPQEPVVKYREKEYNIFLTSSDRDWFRNRTENRYSFSVTFNPGNRSGFGLSPSVQERFRNIQRIEFVKALLPTESLNAMVRRQSDYALSPAFTTNTDRVLNVLGLPFVGVRIAELNNNGFSTNPREDNTFAIVQYDATWNSSSSVTNSTSSSVAPRTNVGYTAYIPKFLKAQRIYEPTPLAGLQKMTFRVERHDGVILSDDPDVFAIQRICLSDDFNATIAAGSTRYFSYKTAAGGSADNSYIIIRTDTFFPYSAVSEGDLIAIQGYAAQQVSSSPAKSTLDDFNAYINNTHYVVSVGYTNDNAIPASGAITDGANSVGYCNIIVIRSRFNDPTSGATDRSYFGGSYTEENNLVAALDSTNQPVETSTAALLNTSRQTHMVLRVITRDMDSGSNIRPDNV